MTELFDRQFIDRFIGNITQAVERATSKTVMHIYGDVVLATPVDKGPLRASWVYGEGKPSNEIPTFPESSSGSPVTAPQLRLEARLDSKVSHHLVNNQPYGEKIEGGSSKQAPSGIITPLEPRMKAVFEAYMEQESP